MSVIISKLLLLFFLFSEAFQHSVIVLPFQELPKNISEATQANYDSKKFLEQYITLNNYVNLKIGTPTKILPIVYNLDVYTFSLIEDISNISEKINLKETDLYNPFESTSYVNSTAESRGSSDVYLDYSIINDTIKFYTNDSTLKKEIEVPNFQYYFNDKYINATKFSGKFNFFMTNTPMKECVFLKELKNLDIINSPIVTVEYSSSKDKGFIYIGEYPHVYNKKKFNENQLMTTYVDVSGYYSKIQVRMSKIYYYINGTENKTEISNDDVVFNLNSGLIYCPKEYLAKIGREFFEEYETKNICEKESISYNTQTYTVYHCKKDKEFHIETFPTLYISNKNLGYTFELKYSDLFAEIDNKYYFLAVYASSIFNYFEIGKPFLQKYQITYNNDAKTVHFYNTTIQPPHSDEDGNGNNEGNKTILNIVLYGAAIACIIGLMGLSFYFGKKCYQQRRKRANELKEDIYDYQADEDGINNLK